MGFFSTQITARFIINQRIEKNNKLLVQGNYGFYLLMSLFVIYTFFMLIIQYFEKKKYQKLEELPARRYLTARISIMKTIMSKKMDIGSLTEKNNKLTSIKSPNKVDNEKSKNNKNNLINQKTIKKNPQETGKENDEIKVIKENNEIKIIRENDESSEIKEKIESKKTVEFKQEETNKQKENTYKSKKSIVSDPNFQEIEELKDDNYIPKYSNKYWHLVPTYSIFYTENYSLKKQKLSIYFFSILIQISFISIGFEIFILNDHNNYLEPLIIFLSLICGWIMNYVFGIFIEKNRFKLIEKFQVGNNSKIETEVNWDISGLYWAGFFLSCLGNAIIIWWKMASFSKSDSGEWIVCCFIGYFIDSILCDLFVVYVVKYYVQTQNTKTYMDLLKKLRKRGFYTF